MIKIRDFDIITTLSYNLLYSHSNRNISVQKRILFPYSTNNTVKFQKTRRGYLPREI